MTTTFHIENVYLCSANIYSPKERFCIASEWNVSFEDGRVKCYRITLIKGTFANEYFNDKFYIQIDDCSISKDRNIFLYPNEKKELKRRAQEYYKITKESFKTFDMQKPLFRKKSTKNIKLINIIKPYLKDHIEKELSNLTEETPLLCKTGKTTLSVKEMDSKKSFHHFFCCFK